MATKVMGACYSCGYPIAAEFKGEQVSCPMCGSINESITGVTIPGWLLVGLGAFAAGIVLGPAVLASTEAGSKYLEKQARERLK